MYGGALMQSLPPVNGLLRFRPELEVLDDDLRDFPLLLLFVLPLPRFEPSLNVERRSFHDVLAHDFRRLSPKYAVGELRLFLLRPCFVRPRPIRRYSERRHRLTARRCFQFGIRRRPSDELHFIEVHWF